MLAMAFAAMVYRTDLPHQFAERSAVMKFFERARPALKLPPRCAL